MSDPSFDPASYGKKLLEQLESGDMPPEEAKQQPTAQERRELTEWMKQLIDGEFDDPNARDPGPPVVRRLTIGEYNRTIKDLLNIDANISGMVGMPEDAIATGFGNLAAGLDVSASLMEKYMAAADEAMKQVFFLVDPELAEYGATLTDKRIRDKARKAYETLVIARADIDTKPHDAAKEVIVKFGRRVYRRPMTEAEIGRYLGIFDGLIRQGKVYDTALRLALEPMLVSPNFIFRMEHDHASAGSQAAYRVNDHEMAVRLSYFLWSTMPDDELFAAADRGELSDPAGLDRQITRMLADPRARTLTDGFGAQWLQLGKLNNARPSTEFFPMFTNKLKGEMREEAITFFDKLREEDRPITDLLDSDYTYLNDDLAAHYGIAGVKGSKFVRVALKPEDHRGGLLGMGAVLASTSHTFRTSPTLRGRYVLDVIFGTPPAPPPANAGQIKDEKAKGQTVHTFREQLARHATDATCAGCHRKMDPLGFALDNYDAIGRWRDTDGNGAIDATGKLPTGETFIGVSELKKMIHSRQGMFVRGVAEAR